MTVTSMLDNVLRIATRQKSPCALAGTLCQRRIDGNPSGTDGRTGADGHTRRRDPDTGESGRYKSFVAFRKRAAENALISVHP